MSLLPDATVRRGVVPPLTTLLSMVQCEPLPSTPPLKPAAGHVRCRTHSSASSTDLDEPWASPSACFSAWGTSGTHRQRCASGSFDSDGAGPTADPRDGAASLVLECLDAVAFSPRAPIAGAARGSLWLVCLAGWA